MRGIKKSHLFGHALLFLFVILLQVGSAHPFEIVNVTSHQDEEIAIFQTDRDKVINETFITEENQEYEETMELEINDDQENEINLQVVSMGPASNSLQIEMNKTDHEAEQSQSKEIQEVEITSQMDHKELNLNDSETIDKKEDEGDMVEVEKDQNAEIPLDQKIATLLDKMTLEEKIGQMMVVGFQSKQVDEHIKTMIEDYHVGGIILYDRNMETPEQVAVLNNDLQNLAKESSQWQIPLMMSIDQEGGKIVRMRDRVSPIPSQQELGKRGSGQEIYATAKRTGKELAAMGIHANYAPDLDLSSTDTRSFGENPEYAYQFGKEVVNGLNDSGVVATLKHFPGNGRSSIDPHKDTSSVDANKWDLENNDVYPFKKIIENVEHNRFFVMVTHIKYPAYDQEKPASISPVIIQDLLRKQLGYTGIVVTDDLEMGAVSKYFTYQDLGFEAVSAGADLLLVCHTFKNQDQVYKGILYAVQSGKLAEARIDEAVERILRYKLTSIPSIYIDPNIAKSIVGK